MMIIKFLTELVLTVLNDSTFRLMEDYYVSIDEVEVVVPEGFETDLASVPRLPIVYLAMGSTGHKAAVLHDWLYATNMYPKEYCDKCFYEALLVSGVGKFHAWSMYMGVKVGGASAYRTYTARLKEQKENQNGASTS